MVAIGPRRFDQTEDAPTELGSGSSIGEQNILPRNGNRSGHVFGLDIGDRQAAVITVALQRLGVIDQVLQRLTCAGMDHTLALYLARPGDKLLPVGHGLRLASFILMFDGQNLDVAFDRVEPPVPVQTLLGDGASRLFLAQPRAHLVEPATRMIVTQCHAQIVTCHHLVEVRGAVTHQGPAELG